MFDRVRTDWQNPNQPVTGPLISLPAVDTVVIHYTAASNVPDGDVGESQTQIPQYLRNMQNYYVTARGYSVGYNATVDVWGTAWELRGTQFKCAANKHHNDHTFAVLLLVDGDDRASDLMAARVRRLVADLQRLTGRKLKIVAHGDIGVTSCPGKGLRQDIVDGRFNPEYVPDPDPVEDVMTAVMVRFKGYLNVWLVGVGPALHLSPELFAHYTALKVPYLNGVAVHNQMLKAFLTQSGCTVNDLVTGG
jgi:hypothetical protein